MPVTRDKSGRWSASQNNASKFAIAVRRACGRRHQQGHGDGFPWIVEMLNRGAIYCILEQVLPWCIEHAECSQLEVVACKWNPVIIHVQLNVESHHPGEGICM